MVMHTHHWQIVADICAANTSAASLKSCSGLLYHILDHDSEDNIAVLIELGSTQVLVEASLASSLSA